MQTIGRPDSDKSFCRHFNGFSDSAVIAPWLHILNVCACDAYKGLFERKASSFLSWRCSQGWSLWDLQFECSFLWFALNFQKVLNPLLKHSSKNVAFTLQTRNWWLWYYIPLSFCCHPGNAHTNQLIRNSSSIKRLLYTFFLLLNGQFEEFTECKKINAVRKSDNELFILLLFYRFLKYFQDLTCLSVRFLRI